MDRRTFLKTSITAGAGLPFTLKLFKAGLFLSNNPDFRIWNRLGGPIGGLGYNVRYRPDKPETFFVTDAWTGLQRSDNAGEDWYPANNGIDYRFGPSDDAIPVFAFRVDVNNNNILWAGMEYGGGLYKSTDGGETWLKKDNGIVLSPDPDTNDGVLTMRHIEVEPGNSEVVYAMGEMHTARWGHEFERVKGYVYKTTDGGENWALLKVFDSLTRWMFINPNNTNRILLATGIFDREADTDDPNNQFPSGNGAGMFYSDDGGITWNEANTGISALKSMFMGGADINPNNPQEIIIAAGNNNDRAQKSKNGAVYKTTDFGQTWTDISPYFYYPLEPMTAIAYAPSNPNIVYAGSAEAIYRSTNGGSGWTRHSGPNFAPYGPPGVRSGVPIDMVVSADDPNTLYVNNYGGGVFKSTDGAKNWMSWSKGYSGADIHGLDVHPNDPEWVMANGRSGIFTSSDAGANWTGISYGTAAFPEGAGTAFDPSDPTGNTRFACDEFESFILRSTNGGKNWQTVNYLQTGEVGDRHGVRNLRFAPSDSNIVYAGYMAAGLHADPHQTNFAESLGIYKSTDGGESWASINSGLPTGAQAKNVTDIAVSHQNTDVVYISLRDGGLYKTENGGQSWQAITGALPAGQNWNDLWLPEIDPIPRHSLFSVAVHPKNDQLIFIGCNIHGLYKSENGGQNWTQVLTPQTMIENGTSDHGHIMSIVFDPITPANMYAAEWHGGVYESTDGGESWKIINEALSTRAVAMLRFSGKGEYLYAATQGEGVFRYQLREVIKTDVEANPTLPVSIRLKQNYPNPFNPGTTINYSIQKSGFVKLTVYNSLGQSVATLINRIKTSGNHSVYFDASQLSSGNYLYVLEANGAKVSKQMVLVK